MKHFNYNVIDDTDSNLKRIEFNSQAEAEAFAKAMYSWQLVNAQNGYRVPILKGGKYTFRVSTDELALIHQKNTEPLDDTFYIFSPLLLNAAECVRRDFMSSPYKGAQHKKLDPKDFDEFEMVDFYVAPPGTWVNPKAAPADLAFKGYSKIKKFRTDVEHHAKMASAILKRNGFGDKTFKPRYEVLIENTTYANDPSSGYQLSSVELDSLDDLDNQPKIQEWLALKDDAASLDARFLAIKCKNQLVLFGYDKQSGKYCCLTNKDAPAGSSARSDHQKVGRYIHALFQNHPPGDDLTPLEINSEKERDVLKMGKCFAHHPNQNQIDITESNQAWFEYSQAIRDEIKTNNHPVHVELYETLDDMGKAIKHFKYFFDKPEEAKVFEEAVQQRLSESSRLYLKLKTKKEFAAMVTVEEDNVLLEQLPGEFIVRPNHGFTHSVRVASYVPILIEHYKSHATDSKCQSMDKLDVRMAQLAMLYSVVGRETEVGFGSQAKVKAICDRYDAEIEKIRVKIEAEKAVGNVVEVQNLEQVIADIKIKRSREVEKQQAQGEEYYNFRETSALAFLKYAEDSGFAKTYKEAKGDKIRLKLNSTFAKKLIDDMERLGLANFAERKGFQLIAKHPLTQEVTIEIDRMHYLAAVLFAMSSPDYQNNLTDGFADIFAKAHGLDLMRCYSKHPSNPASFSIGTIVNSLDIAGTAESKESGLNVCKFAIRALEETGNRLTVGINEDGDIIDQYTPADYDKNIPCANQTDACVRHLAAIEEPAMQRLGAQLGAHRTVFSAEDRLSTLSEHLPIIQGVYRNKQFDDWVDLRFESDEQKQLFFELIVQAGFFKPEDLEISVKSNILVIEREAFDKMQGYVRYRQVKVPDVHNEIETLVNDKGEIAALAMVKDCKAIVRNFDGAKDSTLKFNFDQLNDPMHVRPPSRLQKGHQAHRLAYDRLILMDMSKDDITETIKHCEFDIDEDIHEFKTWDEAQAHLKSFREAEEARGDNPTPQRFKVFRHKYNYVDPKDGKVKENVYWRCYGKDNSGRWQDKAMNYVGTVDEFKANHNELMMQTVVYYGYYKRLTRGTRDYVEPEKQFPVDEEGKTIISKKSDFYKEEEILSPDGTRLRKMMGKPINRYEDRGKPANTIYTKKVATSLMRPDGKMQMFNPDEWTEYLPIGMMYDLEKCYTLGERFIWETDAYTDDRFWLGDLAQRKQQCYEFNKGGQNISLAQLQERLKNAALKGEDATKWNELLCGLTKTALKGLFVQDDNPVSRIAMMYKYKQIKDEYNIDVPVFIMDAKNEPRMFTESQFKEDLKLLLLARKTGNYDKLFNSKKSDAMQIRVMNEFLQSIDYVNIKVSNPNIDAQVEVICDKVNMMGRYKREKAYIDDKWDDEDVDIQRQCIQRALALGHNVLAKELRNRQGNDQLNESMDALLSDESSFNEYKAIIEQSIARIKALEDQRAHCLAFYPNIQRNIHEITQEMNILENIIAITKQNMVNHTIKYLEEDGPVLNESQRDYIADYLFQKPDLGVQIKRLETAVEKMNLEQTQFERNIQIKHDEYKDILKAMISHTVSNIRRDLANFEGNCGKEISSSDLNKIGMDDLNKIIGALYQSENLTSEQLIIYSQHMEEVIKKIQKRVAGIRDPNRGWFTFQETQFDRAKRDFNHKMHESLVQYRNTVMQAPPPANDALIEKMAHRRVANT